MSTHKNLQCNNWLFHCFTVFPICFTTYIFRLLIWFLADFPPSHVYSYVRLLIVRFFPKIRQRPIERNCRISFSLFLRKKDDVLSVDSVGRNWLKGEIQKICERQKPFDNDIGNFEISTFSSNAFQLLMNDSDFS